MINLQCFYGAAFCTAHKYIQMACLSVIGIRDNKLFAQNTVYAFMHIYKVQINFAVTA